MCYLETPLAANHLIWLTTIKTIKTSQSLGKLWARHSNATRETGCFSERCLTPQQLCSEVLLKWNTHTHPHSSVSFTSDQSSEFFPRVTVSEAQSQTEAPRCIGCFKKSFSLKHERTSAGRRSDLKCRTERPEALWGRQPERRRIRCKAENRRVNDGMIPSRYSPTVTQSQNRRVFDIWNISIYI